MIRFACLILSCLMTQQALYPQNAVRFTTIDKYVAELDIGQKSLASFTAGVLTRQSQTEIEKAWAIYAWITRNISYDCRAFHNKNTTKIKYTSEEELVKKMAKIEERELRRTVKLRKGVCEDYAQLFSAMCSYVGIESEIVTGYGRTSYRDIGRETRYANHAWNRFRADGNWYLLDATWGAGFTDAGVKRFTRDFRPAYFMMTPEDMIKNHVPDKAEWQQLTIPLTKGQIANQAIYHYGYWRYRVKELAPDSGFVQGKTIAFRLTLDTEVNPGNMAVVQDDLIIHQGFTKTGNIYTAEVSLKKRSKRRIMVGIRTGKQKFDAIVEYKLK